MGDPTSPFDMKTMVRLRRDNYNSCEALPAIACRGAKQNG